MKWQLVKRVNLLILISVVLIALAFKLLFPATPKLPSPNVKNNFQMGFYDLISQQKEVYDVRLETTRGVLITNITNPNDNRFVLKGKFTPAQEKQGKIYFNLTLIFYSSGRKGLMIDGLVDQLMYSSYSMTPLSFNDQSLVVGQNGAIFLYPLRE